MKYAEGTSIDSRSVMKCYMKIKKIVQLYFYAKTILIMKQNLFLTSSSSQLV